MAQKKLVTNSPDTANKLKQKLQQFRPGREFAVYGITFGYQVVEIRRFAGYGYSWDGQRWVKQKKMPGTTQTARPAPPAPSPLTVTVELPFDSESKAYIGAVQDGVVRWFGKSTLIHYEVANDRVSMTLPAKLAAKRGLA